ncbi:transcriptional-regulating factor 1 isoform X2 [Phyllobates terribilis]|uniref:transcriptional-regulating factor 1 isoform X2 n=1 Tax=Phyllobates terribilis TaxID=111132 RepID=UPI003CCA7162
MEEQQMYKTPLGSRSSDSMYYQQMQHQANSLVLNHSYDSLDMNASESSSSSPHLSQDSRDVTINPAAKSTKQVEASRSWSNIGNHTQGGNNINCYDQSLQWNSQVQTDPASGAYQMSYYPELDNHPKVTSRALHKLDSFTQVFSRQNLRIHAMAQGLPEQSLADCDSTLRQLLSVKSTGEQQVQPATMDRYPQVSQQMNQSLPNQEQKHHLPPVQQSQSHFYYDYFQMQPDPLMQQGQQYGQQVQSNPAVQQTRYYMQHHQPEQHRLLHQTAQQQDPFSGQLSDFYQVQSAGQEMHHNVSQSHHHQVQQQHQQAYRSSKVDHYSPNQPQDLQLIQLGSVPPYMFQSASTVRNSYKSNATPQMTLHQDLSLQKPYKNKSQPQVLMDRSVGLANTDNLNSYSQDNLGMMADSAPQRHTLSQDASYLLNSQSALHSPSTMWPQVSDGKVQTISPDSSKFFLDESKSRLTCSICFKEFRSLPALNGHLRSHGGVRTTTAPKQDEGQKSQTRETDNLTPIVMPVSVPVKLVPSDANAQLSCRADQPENNVSDDEMPILTRMTYSPPSSPKADRSCTSSEIIRNLQEPGMKLGKSDGTKPPQERRKYRHRPEPLFIPPPSFSANPSHSGAMLYQSQLRSPRHMVDPLLLRTQEPPTYTPPPMLSPVRQGSGLFSSVVIAAHNAHLPLTPLTPTPRVLLCRPNSIDGISATPGPGEKTVDVEPKINIGSRFQAEIPDLQRRSLIEKDKNDATLVWKPWPDLEREELQPRLEIFLNTSCSSILPGGGTNIEYALHSLFEAKGNIMTALEMLLLKNTPRLKTHPLATYHYAGSDYWTNNEKKSFNKAINTCNKDFYHVQKMIKTKSVSQCVEYYYTWKKILHMGRRHRTRLIQLHEEDTSSVDEVDEEYGGEHRKYEAQYEPVQKTPDLLHPAEADHSLPVTPGPPAGTFMCEMGNCGAIFCSRQALNGHARIHGGTTTPAKMFTTTNTGRPKPGAQSEHCSVKSSPAHSTTSGETDATSVFPCKLCGKVFYKIKSRNAHMKTHRQQEEQHRQKAQKAAVAAEMADTIARTIVRTTLPTDDVMSFDPFSLIKTLEEDFDDDVAQDLEDVLEETEVMHSDLILDDEDADLLQDGDL